MNTVRYILPDIGEVVEVPASDAAHFDAKGWKREDGTTVASERPAVDTGDTEGEDGTTVASAQYADLSNKQLLALCEERGIAPAGQSKRHLIEALTKADQQQNEQTA